MKKRGMSAVVTTLIIILLAIVALGIIWVVVKNIIQGGADEVDLGRITLDLQIESVEIQDDGVTVIVLRRNPGQGEFIGMKFVFSNGTDSEIIREDTSLEELEHRAFIFILTKLNISTLTEISVSPIYKTNSGEESFGDIADSIEVSDKMKEGITGKIISQAYGGAFEERGHIGEGLYSITVSGNPGIYPEFKSASVDPLDVLPGDNQTFTTTVYSPYEVVNVTTITQLDNEILNLPLEKISDDGSGTSTWSATWIV